MLTWEEDRFDDLSAIWLRADIGEYSLSVEFQAYGKYRAWVSDSAGDIVCVAAESILEAQELAEDIYVQHLLDIHGEVLFGL